jgi:hypothetical protein
MRRVVVIVIGLSLSLGALPPAGAHAGGVPLGALAPQTHTVTMRLSPVAPARVHGTAMLTAIRAGTRVVVDVRGLPPGARALSALHGGTCSHFGLSTTVVVALRADATGRARATARLLFHGRQDIRLAVLTDGDHVIVIFLDAHLVACGTIPRVSSQ